MVTSSQGTNLNRQKTKTLGHLMVSTYSLDLALLNLVLLHSQKKREKYLDEAF